MTVLISAVAFVLLLTFLILIHELGHFLLARLFGVEVEEFGFGLPPKAKHLFRRGKTDFTLNWIPFGGFVRLKGENAIDLEERYAPGSFAFAPLWARFLILLGGVAMNFALAFTLLVFGFSVGRWVPNFYGNFDELERAAARGEVQMQLGVYVDDVLPGGTAAKAGIMKGSTIESVDGTAMQRPDDLIRAQQGKTDVTYVVLEGANHARRSVHLLLQDGKSGIIISQFAAQLSAPRRSIGAAIVLAGRETTYMTVQTIKGITNLVQSLVFHAHVPEGITGIVGIAVLTNQSVQEGAMTYLRLVALLSLSLAILNVLPLPALDGGRLLFLVIEGVIRRRLNQRFELVTNTIGFFVLISLIVIITFNDVIRLF